MLRSVVTRTVARVAGSHHGGVSMHLLAVESQRSYSSGPKRSEFGFGGRCSVSGVIATVFGSSGFAGRYVVNRLGRIGSQVMAGYRGEDLNIRHLKVMGDLGQIVPTRYDIRDENSLEEAMYRSNVVINLIGRRWDTRNFTLAEANNESAARLAKIAARVGVEQFIHVSALGAHEDSTSTWAREKAKGEKAVREAFPDATILRPGPLFGHEDRTITNWAAAVRNWPFVPVFRPHAEFNPLSVGDLAAAVIAAVENPAMVIGKTYELGTPNTYTQEAIIEHLNEILNFHKRIVPVPKEIAKLAAKGFAIQRRPRWYTPDEVELLDDPKGAVFTPSSLRLSDLGLKAKTVEEMALSLSRHYRKPQYANLIIE